MKKLSAATNVSSVSQSKKSKHTDTVNYISFTCTLNSLPFFEKIKYLQFILLMLFLSHVCWLGTVDLDQELKTLNSGSSQELRNSEQSTSKFGS